MRLLIRIRGFTLIEMIVSLAIFSIVAVVALAALVKIIDANDKAQTIQAAVTSMSFSLDDMSRDLRTGSNVYCGALSGFVSTFSPSSQVTTACSFNLGSSNGPFIISFESARTSTSGCRLWYAYLFTIVPTLQLEKAEQASNSLNCTDTFTSSSFTSVVPTNVTLSSFILSVSYNSTTQPDPLVFIEFSGSAGTKEQAKTYFTVQTAVSPRTP